MCPMYPRTKQVGAPIHAINDKLTGPSIPLVPLFYVHLFAQIAALLTTGKDHRPIVLCEYAHSMGNSTGELG
eukprot:scaffold163307_cov15-Tisochrysis_lutea.AAC.1